jgi:hypothetical protein
MKNPKHKLAQGAPRVVLQRGVSLPVEVWWGLEWVKTNATILDGRTIMADLINREGHKIKTRIHNSIGIKMWRRANAAR